MQDEHHFLEHGIPNAEKDTAIAQDAQCLHQDQMTGQPVQPPCSAPDRHTGLRVDEDCRECLAALTHRLAQPITALRGGIELALLGKRSMEDFRPLLEQSFQLADQMAQMLISLRDLGESGQPGGNIECFPVEAIAAEVFAELENLAQSRDLRLQLHADGEFRVSANPERLREVLQNLFAWVIMSSAGPGTIRMEITLSEGEVQTLIAPPRLDLQYLQIKVLEEFTTPGKLFSVALKNGGLGWTINQRLVNGLGGKLEILTDGPHAGSIRLVLPQPAPAGAASP